MIPWIVVEKPGDWPLEIPGVSSILATDYLNDPQCSEATGVTVFNLCRRFSYQSVGYYVSLLAEARGHRPLPSVTTLQDLRQAPLLRIVSDELESVLHKGLATLHSDDFVLSIYFGHNLAKRYDRLCQAIFSQFPAPFLRASFERDGGKWRLVKVAPIATTDIPDSHRDFVLEQAHAFFARRSLPRQTKREYRYDIAILVDPEEQMPPSNEKAQQKFAKAAKQCGLNPTAIGPGDIGRLAEFDALFIRETTGVDHHTYRFARRAEALGLVVIDDPGSILRCCNKVFQHEVFTHHNVSTPKTMVVHRGNADRVADELGLPVVLKRPDSSFSQGVSKAKTAEDLESQLTGLLKASELVLAQEFVPSDFDWRIGVLSGRALWACKYFMAKHHWQIIASEPGGSHRSGKVDTYPTAEVPKAAVKLAVRAANLMGDGLYGVDLKELDGHYKVMEVNDNPSLDAGYEDRVLGDDLYLAIMQTFRERLDARGSRSPRS
ncbi:MAG: RimK family protein [Planctomycetota bacterium]